MSSKKKPNPNYEEFRKRRDEEKFARQERIKDRLNEIRLNKLANVAKLNAELKENQFYVGAIAGAGATQKIQKTGSVAAANQKPLLPNNANKTEPTLQSAPIVKGSPVRKVETKAAIKNVPTKKSFGGGGIVPASARKSPRVINLKSKVDLISNRRQELNVWKKDKDLQIKKLVSSNTSKLVGQTKSFLSKTTSNLSADKKSLVKNSSTAVNKTSLNKTVNQCPPNKQKIDNTFSKKTVPIQIAPTSKKASSVAASHPARRMTVIHSNVVTKRNSLSKQFLKSRKSIAVVANSALGFSNKHNDVALKKTANNTKSTTKSASSAEVVIAATQQPLTTEPQPHSQRATTSTAAAATSTTSTQPQKPISYTIDIKPIPSSVTKRRRTTMFKSQYQPKENLTKSVMKEKLTDWLKTQGKSPTAYKRHMCCYGLHKDSPLHSSTAKKAQPKEHMRLKNLKLESIKLPSLSISLNNDDNITSDKNDVKTLTITEEPASSDKNEEPTSSDKRERRTTEGNVAGCVAPQSERKLPNRGVRIMGEVQEKNVFRSSDIFYLCKEIKENLNRTSSFLDRSSLINVDCSNSSNNSKSQTTPASKRSFEKSIIKPDKTNNDGDDKRDDDGDDKRDDDGGKREGDDKKDEHLGNKSVKKCRFHHDEKRNGRNDHEDKGGDGDESVPPFFGTPHKKCYVITPVRRSTRKSCLATKHSVMDGDVIVESMDELPVETKERSIFRSNKRIAIFGNSDAERDNHDNNNNNNNGGEIDGKGVEESMNDDDDDVNSDDGENAKRQLEFD